MANKRGWKAQSLQLTGRGILLFFVIATVLLAGTLIVTKPYQEGGYFWDDIIIFQTHALADEGRMPLLVHFIAPHGGHLFPGWKGVMYASVRLFGLDVAATHIVSAVSHAVSALLVFAVLRRFRASLSMSIMAACLWSWSTTGRFDLPAHWFSAGVYTLSLIGILIGLWAESFIDQSKRSAVPRWIMIAGMVVSFLANSMFVLWIPAMLIPIAFAWRSPVKTPNEWRRWLFTWMLAFIPLLALSVLLFLLEAKSPVRNSPWIMANGILSQFAFSLRQLLSCPTQNEPSWVWKIAGAAIAAAWINRQWRWPTGSTTVTWAILYVAGVNSVLTVWSREESTFDSGRYIYPHGLFWSLIIAQFASDFITLLYRPLRRAATVASVALLVVYLQVQALNATQTQASFDAVYGRNALALRDIFEFLEQSQNRSRELDRVIWLPNLPLRIHENSLYSQSFTLEMATRLHFGNQLTHVRFKPVAGLTDEERERAEELLAESSLPGSKRLRDDWKEISPDLDLFQELSRYASEMAMVIQMPNVPLDYPLDENGMTLRFQASDVFWHILMRRPASIMIDGDPWQGILAAEEPPPENAVRLEELLTRWNESADSKEITLAERVKKILTRPATVTIPKRANRLGHE